MKGRLFIYILTLVVSGQLLHAQLQTHDSTTYSYSLRKFYDQYDSVIVYRKTCSLSDIGESIILAKKDKNWKSYRAIEVYKYDDQLGHSTIKKVKLRKYKIDKSLIVETKSELLSLGMLKLNEDSLDYCESKPFVDENGVTNTIVTMSLDGCGYRFEFMTANIIYLVRARGNIRACQELTGNKNQEKFLNCQDLFRDKLQFEFENKTSLQ